jgi:cytochrome c6
LLQREHLMKRIVSVLLLGMAIFTFAFSRPALAGDAASGAKVFSANCASCHAGGKNLVNAQKTLQKDVLEKYDMYSEDAIITQVTKGKNAMPAFGGRLKPDQIADVASYVLSQADKGWK